MKNPRVDKAFNAMKPLGISHDKVKPVLKHLLKLYDKNWAFIEAENYRVLVDAIFEDNDEKEVEVKRKKTVDSDASEPPLKKMYVEPEEDEASSTVDTSEMLAVLEKGDIQPTSFPAHSNLVNTRAEPGSCSGIDKGKGQQSSSLISTCEKMTSERASSSLSSKLAAYDAGSPPMARKKVPAYCRSDKLKRLDVHQCDTGSIPLIRSTTKTHSALPDLLEDSSMGNASAKSYQFVDPENTKKCGSSCSFPNNECKFDIASLPSEDMKLCCASALAQVTNHTPDVDAVLKSVEEKLLRSNNIVGPSFSLSKLLEQLCESFFEFTTKSIKRSSVRKSSLELISQDRKKSPAESVALKNLEVSNTKKSETETSRVLGDVMIMKQKTGLYVDDITKGEENIKISLVDEHSNGDPPKFFYIPRNIIYQKAIVNVSLARVSEEDCCPSCIGDCLSLPVPCACARTTNGEFAYTKKGLLKEEFLRACVSENRLVYCQDCPIERAKNERKPQKCKGHSVRRFIKECWSKCGCNMQCGNRVVQRGITRKLQVFWTSEGKGWGLRTVEDLPKGAFVCEYVGEIVTNTELDERNKRNKGNERHTYPVQLDADWGSESILDDDFALCLDATIYGNVARFINHRCCNSNLFEIPVEVETVDHHYYHLAFFTTEEVKAFEELTWDYGLDFDDESHPVKAFRCCCGSAFCRDKCRRGSKSKARAASVR